MADLEGAVEGQVLPFTPYFITANVLQPPWADPMAIFAMTKYLVGMGLKAGDAEPGAEKPSEGVVVPEEAAARPAVEERPPPPAKPDLELKEVSFSKEGAMNALSNAGIIAGRAASTVAESAGAAVQAASVMAGHVSEAVTAASHDIESHITAQEKIASNEAKIKQLKSKGGTMSGADTSEISRLENEITQHQEKVLPPEKIAQHKATLNATANENNTTTIHAKQTLNKLESHEGSTTTPVISENKVPEATPVEETTPAVDTAPNETATNETAGEEAPVEETDAKSQAGEEAAPVGQDDAKTDTGEEAPAAEEADAKAKAEVGDATAATLQDKIESDAEIIKAKRQLKNYNDLLKKNNSPSLRENMRKLEETINKRTQRLRSNDAQTLRSNEALNKARNKWFAKPENINKNMADWENEGIHEEMKKNTDLDKLEDKDALIEFHKEKMRQGDKISKTTQKEIEAEMLKSNNKNVIQAVSDLQRSKSTRGYLFGHARQRRANKYNTDDMTSAELDARRLKNRGSVIRDGNKQLGDMELDGTGYKRNRVFRRTRRMISKARGERRTRRVALAKKEAAEDFKDSYKKALESGESGKSVEEIARQKYKENDTELQSLNIQVKNESAKYKKLIDAWEMNKTMSPAEKDDLEKMIKRKSDLEKSKQLTKLWQDKMNENKPTTAATTAATTTASSGSGVGEVVKTLTAEQQQQLQQQQQQQQQKQTGGPKQIGGTKQGESTVKPLTLIDVVDVINSEKLKDISLKSYQVHLNSPVYNSLDKQVHGLHNIYTDVNKFRKEIESLLETIDKKSIEKKQKQNNRIGEIYRLKQLNRPDQFNDLNQVMHDLYKAIEKGSSNTEQVVELLRKGFRLSYHLYSTMIKSDLTIEKVNGNRVTNHNAYFKDKIHSYFFCVYPFIELSKHLNLYTNNLDKLYYKQMIDVDILVTSITNVEKIKQKARYALIDREVSDMLKTHIKNGESKFEKKTPEEIEQLKHKYDKTLHQFKIHQTHHENSDEWKYLKTKPTYTINTLKITLNRFDVTLNAICEQAENYKLKHNGSSITDIAIEPIVNLCSLFSLITHSKHGHQTVLFKMLDEGIEKIHKRQIKSFKSAVKRFNTKGKMPKEKGINYIDMLEEMVRFINNVKKDLLSYTKDTVTYDFGFFAIHLYMEYILEHFSSITDGIKDMIEMDSPTEKSLHKHHEHIRHVTEAMDLFNEEIGKRFTEIKLRHDYVVILSNIPHTEVELEKFLKQIKSIKKTKTLEDRYSDQLKEIAEKGNEIMDDKDLFSMSGGSVIKYTKKNTQRKNKSLKKRQIGGTILSQMAHNASMENNATSNLDNHMEMHNKINQQMQLKANNIKQQIRLHKKLLHLKKKQIKDATQSCLARQLYKPSLLSCERSCLRQLQNANPGDSGVHCGCKNPPKGFPYLGSCN